MPTLFPFPFTEVKFSLEWLTSVTLSYDWEQRDVLRQVPRLAWQGTADMTAEESRHAENILLSNGGSFLLPDWRYSRRVKPISLGVTSQLAVKEGWPHVVGEQVVFVYNQESLLATITAVDPVSITVDKDVSAFHKITAWMMPVHTAALIGNVKKALYGNDQVGVSFTATVTEYRDLSSYAVFDTFNGDVVLLTRDLFTGSGYQTFNNHVIVDNTVGPVTLNKHQKHPRAGYLYSLSMASAKDMVRQEALLHHFAGRSGQFWKASWLPDFIPQWISAGGTTTLFVKPTDTTLVAERLQAVCISYRDGTHSTHRVGVVASTAYVTTLNLIDPLTAPVNDGTVLMISRMGLQRLDTDKINFNIENGFAASIAVPTVEVLQ